MKIDIFKLNELFKASYQDHELKDCKVVVDAFNRGVRNSWECDVYAENVKKCLSMFRKANVKCFFVFRGRYEDYKITGPAPPTFMRETYIQVLDEMGFDYVICENEATAQCNALAQQLKCPVMAFDRQFCFSTVPYIPCENVSFNEKNNTISCKVFRLDNFYENNRITNEKFVMFIVLKTFCFPPLSLQTFSNMSNECLLRWLSEHTTDDAITSVFRCLNPKEKEKFLSSKKEVEDYIHRQELGSVLIDFLEKGKHIIAQGDSQWFEKGVAFGYIATPYIDLYRSEILRVSPAMMLSLDILKFVYNLLTNFQKQTFDLIYFKDRVLKKTSFNVSHPRLKALCGVQSDSLFKNGWDELNGEALIHNFLIAIVGGVPLNVINQVPEDAKLLMISLAYFSRLKIIKNVNCKTEREAFAIILSYIMLGVVNEMDNGELAIKSHDSGEKMTFDILINKPNFKFECHTASASMKDYLKGSEEAIFDKKMLYTLFEFQHCLKHMNFLNKLCGSPYKPTIYRKTYNSIFINKILHTIKEERAADWVNILGVKLQWSPLIVEYSNRLIALYKKMI